MDSLYRTLYVIVTPDHNWYGPYSEKEAAQEYKYDLKNPRSRAGLRETRPMKITTARYTNDGISIDWPKWRK